MSIHQTRSEVTCTDSNSAVKAIEESSVHDATGRTHETVKQPTSRPLTTDRQLRTSSSWRLWSILDHLIVGGHHHPLPIPPQYQEHATNLACACAEGQQHYHSKTPHAQHRTEM